LANLANFTQFAKNFCPIKKIDFEKLSYREYWPIYYPPIIADSSFTKIFSLQNFVLYGILVCASYYCYCDNDLYILKNDRIE